MRTRRSWIAVIVSFAITVAGCVSRTPAPPSRTEVARLAHGYFLTAVAAVPDKQYRLYWLGSSFEAGGLTFTGPYYPGFGRASDAGGMVFDYDAPATGARSGDLTLLVSSEATWPAKRDALKTTSGISVTSATLLGRPVEVWRTVTGTRPVNQIWVSVDLGDAVVLANAPSVGGIIEGGPDANPLIDEQTLLAALQHLRPYPQ